MGQNGQFLSITVQPLGHTPFNTTVKRSRTTKAAAVPCMLCVQSGDTANITVLHISHQVHKKKKKEINPECKVHLSTPCGGGTAGQEKLC